MSQTGDTPEVRATAGIAATDLRETPEAIVRRVTTDRRTAGEAILHRAATAVHLMADRIARTTLCLRAVMAGRHMVADTTRHRRTVEVATTLRRHTAEAASTDLRVAAVRTCPRVVVLTAGAEVLTEADTAKTIAVRSFRTPSGSRRRFLLGFYTGGFTSPVSLSSQYLWRDA